MRDPVTLDQLRTLVAVADAGSFSAAARRLGRVQSAVSASMANLEDELALLLWDRATRVPTLTDQGRVVLASARRVLGEVDGLKGLAAGMSRGVEPLVSLCVDALFPLPALVDLCVAFAREFPAVELRVDTGVMAAVAARVASGAATLGVVNAAGLAPGFERKVLAEIRMVPVAAPRHPLAAIRGVIPAARFADAVQIVLSEGGDAKSADQAVLSPRTWRVGDLHTKHALIRAGLGWGNLPEHLAREDLRRSRLAPLRPEPWAPDAHRVHLAAIHRPGEARGPAHRWVVAQLAALCVRDAGAEVKGAGSRRARRDR